MKNRNIIIFSSIDWSTHWQIHHQLTTSLIDEGNRVLFIENTGVRAPSVKDFSRIKSRIKSRINSTHGYIEKNEKLTINSPIFFPFPYNRFAIYINTIIISNSIKSWAKKANFNNFLVISFLPTQSVQQTIKKITPTLSVYYCADDMTRTLKNPKKLKTIEQEMFRNSDIVFVSSHKKMRQAKLFNDNTVFAPAGVSIDDFKFSSNQDNIPEGIKSVNTKIIGYIGALSDVLDKKLIIKLANSFQEATLVLIGPIHTDISEFKKINNILLLGEINHNEISNYLQGFNVGLIPYVVNEFTDSVYPCKLNEYLAMGVPVVSSNFEEIRLFEEKYNKSVLLAANTIEFIECIEKILNDSNSNSIKESLKRVEVASNNTWEKRYLDISNTIEGQLQSKFSEVVDWKMHLNDFYKNKNKSRLKKIIIFIFVYLILFKSPMFWFFGEQLVVRETPKKSDAIVVFSGNGESSYQNTSFQRRALDAIRLFNDGYSNNIYLSSGMDQTTSEVKFMKLFILSKGVPEESIHMLRDYPNSTYMNVIMVRDMLDNDNIKSIIFITSPYHSLRALLTWRKNASHIQIIAPEVVDTPSTEVKWGVGFAKIKIILYEYLAIIHNWFNGRL